MWLEFICQFLLFVSFLLQHLPLRLYDGGSSVLVVANKRLVTGKVSQYALCFCKEKVSK